jgi:hypothetical protein
LSRFTSPDISLSCSTAHDRPRRNAMTLRPQNFHITISEFGSIPASFELSLR